jgi:hypothetical protein
MTKPLQNRKHFPVNKVCTGSKISNIHIPDMDTARIFIKGMRGSQKNLHINLHFTFQPFDTIFKQCPAVFRTEQ